MKSIIGSSSAEIDDDDGYLHLFCQPQKVSFGSLEVLDINYNPFCGHEIPTSLFNGLKELTINNCVSTSLFTLSSMAANLVSLTELRIRYCYEMIKVIEDEQQETILLFPKLEMLYLRDLPKLVTFCDLNCEVEFPSLTYVVIEDCPNMENFSMGFVATPNLKIVEIDDEEIGATDLNGLQHQHFIAGLEKNSGRFGSNVIIISTSMASAAEELEAEASVAEWQTESG